MNARPRLVESTALALVLVLAFGAMYAAVAWFALDAFPYSGDEYSTLLQAELFARGLLKIPAPAHVEWLRVDHVVIDAFVRSKYPPGASALLAIGVRAGAPWLVAPVEGAITLLVAWWTTRAALGARAALVALVALGLAPLFVFDSASYYAHAPAVMFLAIAFAAVCAATRRPRTWLYAIAGAALGATFLIRPIDALLFGVAMLSLRSWRAIVVTAVAAVPFVALNLLYQRAQFGSLFTDGYHAYEPTFTALYGASTAANPLSPLHLVDPVQWWNHLDIFRLMITDWTIPGTAIVAVFGAQALGREPPARGAGRFALALIVTYGAALMLMISDPDDGPHPRYLSTILVPLAFLVAAGFGPVSQALASRFGARVRTIVIAALTLAAPIQLAAYFQDRLPQQWKREGLYRATADLHDAVVVIRATYPSRFARNGLFDGPVLYLSAAPTVPLADIEAAYPGRAIYEAHEPMTFRDPWALTRVR
jgi:4-amino-4-deoxy-L-arabinose transferase-like glycosyltransferase